MKFKKKPAIVEAIIWNGNNLKEVMEFIGSEFKYEEDTMYYTEKFTYHKGVLYIGSLLVHIDDYIVKEVDKEFYPCNPKIFLTVYEEVEE